MKDLAVLVADKDMENTIRGLLSRPDSLNINPVLFETLTHPNHDPGCANRPDFILGGQSRLKFQHALVLLDLHGSGKESSGPAALEAAVRDKLVACGWEKHQVECVVIDPELEIWVWSQSPLVDEIMGWKDQEVPLRDWLRKSGLITSGQSKPPDPKAAFRKALQKVKKVPSSALFHQLASRVGLGGCVDPSFGRLVAILRQWYPQSEPKRSS
jgi:hypothetical protein